MLGYWRCLLESLFFFFFFFFFGFLRSGNFFSFMVDWKEYIVFCLHEHRFWGIYTRRGAWEGKGSRRGEGANCGVDFLS